MKLLPKWVLTDRNPAFYDTESGSAIEQTAKVYGAMNELIGEYNDFVDKVNASITEFETEGNQSLDCLANKIIKIVNDYIFMLDEKVKRQDRTINEAIVYIKDNIAESVELVLSEMKESGELDDIIFSALSNIETTIGDLISQMNTLNSDVQELGKGLIGLNNEIIVMKEHSVLIDERIATIENTEYTLVHNEVTEELEILKTIKEGS